MVGRTYAGILGPLAMTVVIFRGVLSGAPTEGTLSAATLNLVVFAGIGMVVGSIAQSTVDDAVRAKLEAELERTRATDQDG